MLDNYLQQTLFSDTFLLLQDEVRNLENKMSETRDLMATPSASAPLSQRMSGMQVGYLPWKGYLLS